MSALAIIGVVVGSAVMGGAAVYGWVVHTIRDDARHSAW